MSTASGPTRDAGSSAWRWADLVERASEAFPLDLHVVVGLQVEPELVAGAEVAGESEGSVGGDPAGAVDDLGDHAGYGVIACGAAGGAVPVPAPSRSPTTPDEPVNEGSFRALRVLILEGNFMMARYPDGVAVADRPVRQGAVRSVSSPPREPSGRALGGRLGRS